MNTKIKCLSTNTDDRDFIVGDIHGCYIKFQTMNTKVKRLPANKQGRDFVVGDLHGCYVELQKLLDHVNFDQSVDRVLSVGDLIDRGAESERCLRLLENDWFHAVKGNHEDMMVKSVFQTDFNSTAIWLDNGGQWIYKTGTWEQKYTHEQLTAFAKTLDALPIVIVVGEGTDRYNIVHAEFYSSYRPLCNDDIDNWTFTPEEQLAMLWGRTVLQYTNQEQLFQYDFSPTYVGHSPMKEIITRQYQYYIDTGCVFSLLKPRTNTECGLTIVDHKAQTSITYHPFDDRFSSCSLPLLGQ